MTRPGTTGCAGDPCDGVRAPPALARPAEAGSRGNSRARLSGTPDGDLAGADVHGFNLTGEGMAVAPGDGLERAGPVTIGSGRLGGCGFTGAVLAVRGKRVVVQVHGELLVVADLFRSHAARCH